MSELPINAVLPELKEALRAAGRAVLSAPPGSGKSTGVPPALLDEPWLAGRSLLMLEPRRLAARAVAARMAQLRGEAVGQTVGYRVRFDSAVSKRTRIEVLTEGILTRRLQGDPGLEAVGLVIFDEFHERSLHADLAMALCLDVVHGLREDLRLLVMSATLDTGAVSDLLGGAPVVTGTGKSHSVQVYYAPAAPSASIGEATAAGIRRALGERSGDVLAFLPGGREIRDAARSLEPVRAAGVLVLPLHGELSRQDQDQALMPNPAGRRRVVLATSIAETSLTIEGVATVVDGGWSRVPRFDPNSALTRLETLRVSRAAADQRAGRAGRLGPGACYRLWSEGVQQSLRDHSDPEILQADLAPLILELALWGVSDPGRLAWLTPPPAGAVAQATDLLRGLGAIDGQGRITEAGRTMAALPVHPRLAHMLGAAGRGNAGALACDLAALLTERDILRGVAARSADVEERMHVLAAWRERGDLRGADRAACARVDRAAAQLRRMLGCKGRAAEVSRTGELLAAAYPDRVAQRRAGAGGRYLLAGGRGATLPEDDPLVGAEYLVAATLDAGGAEGRIYLGAAVDRQVLEAGAAGPVRARDVVAWDGAIQAVTARRERRLGSLILGMAPLARVDPDAVLNAMLEGVRRMGLECLAWTETARQLQTRVLCLRGWCPEDGWPDVSDQALLADLDTWLRPYLTGCTRREHLQRLDLEGILSGLLKWPQRKRLEQGAPTHLQVPSGSRLRLHYISGEPPVLAVRLQEMFGLGETPTVCWGEVPVMLHLLSPAHRPIQVTRDLRGFWERTYAEVRKELKGRYPKHHWPDDPWAAVPTSRSKPRGIE